MVSSPGAVAARSGLLELSVNRPAQNPIGGGRLGRVSAVPCDMKIISEERVVLTAEMMANRVVRPRPLLPRSKGVHVSGIIERIAKANGKLKDKPREDFSVNYPTCMALGVSFEEFAASFYPAGAHMWADEICRDGIHGTPDGFLTQGKIWDWEAKRHAYEPCSIADSWLDYKQALAFGAMTGVRRFCHERLFVKPAYDPQIWRSFWEAEEYECEDWWKYLLKVAPEVEPER